MAPQAGGPLDLSVIVVVGALRTRAERYLRKLLAQMVVTLGHAASLAGESRAYVRAILHRSRADVSQSVAAGPVHP